MLKKKLLVATSFLVLVVFAGTWAFFNSTSSIENEMMTSKYGSQTIEEFTPKQKMEPGKEIEKIVGVHNTGDYPLLARISISEVWERSDTPFKTIPNTSNINTVVYNAGPPKSWTAVQVSATDGVVPGDNATEQTVVYKNLPTLGTNWIDGGDGYFYYHKPIAPGTSTESFMESIIMASNADIGIYKTTQHYSIADKVAVEAVLANPAATEAEINAVYAWTTTKPTDESKITYMKSEAALESGKEGYADADYTLTVTTQILQATKDAVAAEWTMTGTELQAILTGWNLTD